MTTTEKFPGPWEVRKLLDGYKVVAADGRCLAMFCAQPNSTSTLSDEDAFCLAGAFAKIGGIPVQAEGVDAADQQLRAVRQTQRKVSLKTRL